MPSLRKHSGRLFPIKSDHPLRTISIPGAHLAFEEGRGCTFQKGLFRTFWVELQQNLQNLASKTLYYAISDEFEEHK